MKIIRCGYEEACRYRLMFALNSNESFWKSNTVEISFRWGERNDIQ
jgi:hypothetical protein